MAFPLAVGTTFTVDTAQADLISYGGNSIFYPIDPPTRTWFDSGENPQRGNGAQAMEPMLFPLQTRTFIVGISDELVVYSFDGVLTPAVLAPGGTRVWGGIGGVPVELPSFPQLDRHTTTQPFALQEAR